MDEKELIRDLARLIRGELTSGELRRLAKREGCASFSELCEARLPEDLLRLRIGTRDLLAWIDRYRRRAIDLRELWTWADELYNISFNHRIAYEPRSEDLIVGTLSAISVICNEGLFPDRAKAGRGLEYIRACLMRRRKFHLRNIFLRIFEDLPVAHLANKHLDDDADDEDEGHLGAGEGVGDADGDGEAGGSCWADVVLLDRPFDAEKGIATDYNWLIAFTVATTDLHEQELAADAEEEESKDERGADGADGRADDEDEADERGGEARLRGRPRYPAVDRVPALRRLAPNFDFERFHPRYLCDSDGIAEILLDSERIGPAEMRYAAKLFCLANRIGRCFLDGERVPTLVSRPFHASRR